MTRSHCRLAAFAVAFGAATLFPGHASASAITFVAPSYASADSNVSTAGSLFAAVSECCTETVNTVTFTGIGQQTGGIGTSYTSGNFTFNNFNQANINAFGPPTGLSASYGTILDGALFTTNPGVTGTITVSGLTAGDTYQLEFWVNDDRATGRTETITSIGGNSEVLSYGSQTNGGAGQYVIGTFIADSTGSESFTITGDANSPTEVNALQVRDVASGTSAPEPGSLLLCGLTGVTLLAGRRFLVK